MTPIAIYFKALPKQQQQTPGTSRWEVTVFFKDCSALGYNLN